MTKPNTESDPRLVDAALELLKLGVSNTRVIELLTCDIEIVERQLSYLPFRNAKRKEAFIIEAIRNDYSPPKEFYYAQNPADASPEA